VKHLAILIAASPTAAFYSQVAVLDRALRRLPWRHWRYSLHLYLGGAPEPGALETWTPYLAGIDLRWSTAEALAHDGDWAQSDDVFRYAPSGADMILALDADTLPVGALEPLLDQVLDSGVVAGALAHHPTVLGHRDGQWSESSVRAAWTRLARGIVEAPLDFRYAHSLMGPEQPIELREAPFYLNFGVVLFPRRWFDTIAAEYLRIRQHLRGRLANEDFSGQAALTLAIATCGAGTLALPMRYNFPNDPVAERMYPGELAHVAVFHYLRTSVFDRHQIFLTAEHYRAFLARDLEGVDRRFQEAVRLVVGGEYPFG